MTITTSGRRTLVYAAGSIAVVTLLLSIRLIIGGELGGVIFHTLAELITVVIATGAFMVAWNTRRYAQNGLLLYLGIWFLFIAAVDSLHMMAYRGMGPEGFGMFPTFDTDLPTTLWIVARYLQAGAFLTAPIMARRPIKPWPTFWLAGVITAAATTAAFMGWLPRSYIEGSGLTDFKIASEFIIAIAMVSALPLLYRMKDIIDRPSHQLLNWMVSLSIASEIMFMLYGIDVFGVFNLTGHVIRIFAYLALYRAIIVASLSRPLDVMFHDLSATAEALAESEERFRTTFEQASVGIAHIAPEGHWLRVNSRVLDITGYSADELGSLTYRDVTHPDDLGLEERLVDRLLSDEIDQYQIEKRYIRKNGESVWVTVSRTLLRGDDGAPRYFISIIEDITARKRAEAALQRRSELNAALNAIDAQVNATLDIDDTLTKACEWATRGLGAESATITMRTGTNWTVRYTYRFPGDITGESFVDETVPHAVLAAQRGEPIAIEDATSDERVHTATMARYGVASVLAVPLSLRGKHFGTLYLNFHTAVHRFSQEEIDFGRKLMNSLTLAIENAYLYENERSISDTLQNALLKMPLGLPGVEFAHAYRSAAELARIGGDFYDAFRISEHAIGFVIGDVSGKGLQAATLTAMARSTIRAFAHLGDPPSTVMAKANDVIHEQIDEAQFITAIYGTLDTASGTISLACAGHPIPLFRINGRCVQRPIESNPPLGVFAGQLYEQHTLVLKENETILLFSDGLLDARSPSGFLGEQGVCRIVETISSSTVEDLVEGLMDSAQAHAGGHINDDVTIVAFRLDRSR